MRKTILKTSVYIIVCCWSVILILSSISINNNEKLFKESIDRELFYAAGKYANQFSLILQEQESAIEALAGVVAAHFDASQEEYAGKRQVFRGLEKEVDFVLQKVLLEVENMSSIFLTFNPNTSGGVDHLWYVQDEKGSVKSMVTESGDDRTLDWMAREEARSGYSFRYYYDAVEYGEAWIGPYFDLNLEAEVVTYSRAVYDEDGVLIGVVGTDIPLAEIFRTVTSMTIHEEGISALFDENGHYIVGSRDINFSQDATRDSLDQIKGLLQKHHKVSDGLSYSYDGEEFIGAFSHMNNGWTFLVSLPKEKAAESFTQTQNIIRFLGGAALVAVIIFAVFLSLWSFQPILRESEAKDIMLLNQSRQAKLGEMVGNIAHQWKQPLNSMAIELANMSDDYDHDGLSKDVFREYVENMRAAIENLSGTVDDFTDFLKPDRRKEQFCINDIVRRTLALMEESIKFNGISVELSGEEGITAYGFPREFSQGVFNVLNNARDAIIEADVAEKRICINFGRETDKKSGECLGVVDIINSGEPIPEKHLGQVFDPYFTTKEGKGGTGLGLYITRQIVEEHMGGKIEIRNRENGVGCRIVLPAGQELDNHLLGREERHGR